MSGTSYSQDCYKCKGKDSLMISSDWKPHDSSCGECVKCGYSFWTETGTMELDEVNEMRIDRDLRPLKKLAKQTA